MIDRDRTPAQRHCGCTCSNPRMNFENDDASYPTRQCANGQEPIVSFFRFRCTTPGDPMMSFENDQHDENHWLPRCYYRTIRSFEKTRELEPSTQVGDSTEQDTPRCRIQSMTMEHPLAAGMWTAERKYRVAGRCSFWVELIERNRSTRMKNWSR